MSIVLKYWKIILILLLFIAVGLMFNSVIKLRKDNNRLKANQENLTALHDRELTLRREEYKQLNTVWKDKLDSVLKDNKIKLRNVQQATVIQTVYKDTGSTKIIYKDVIQLPDKSFKIPVSVVEECWGMKGYVNSTDANSQLEITERTALNSIQLVVVRKRFLGFLWFNGKTSFKAFNDCGTVDVTKIEFKK
jgi:hypothetical protein